ncbi:hypothetical protein SAMN06297387_1333 [Streptomyces zhaozhouensis]|uniref:Uncharacterized protein n=1 Tax=Streptomyces zhaozhouensis TaxID=1300267 RepID=A0A286E9U7_9ACTN|nr:hypothetical protein SAMN06297387_1333 [Streptomyces zhaozhouensis]
MGCPLNTWFGRTVRNWWESRPFRTVLNGNSGHGRGGGGRRLLRVNLMEQL